MDGLLAGTAGATESRCLGADASLPAAETLAGPREALAPSREFMADWDTAPRVVLRLMRVCVELYR